MHPLPQRLLAAAVAVAVLLAGGVFLHHLVGAVRAAHGR